MFRHLTLLQFLLPLPTLLLFRPILVLFCETEQINYGVFNLIYYNSKI